MGGNGGTYSIQIPERVATSFVPGAHGGRENVEVFVAKMHRVLHRLCSLW